ncbi:YebC/PmpR family DNA-binding transcriptional regulator [Campylobacter sp. JMF_01 NE2]|uniref:YebC/PmpR family DNA-binding transcriptional regulator n=1 Tax=unclassified Campylobacter TaxID=2593542 RepID=UPI0022E9A572|nr:MULTISPECIES: YebC/PmpR family DNA-binding transcriptional regulator [unclassified Campylobacter]MDA3043395.1 YebC/PmpR family DNA-binding transcriptional regulator [Campylobacter sp. JMF_09 ED2]MDA3045148.1 YebC/PmpR family DNA-binding transcriptional regulator [Campylobacter sp. JMF_07 ED4]MDA3046389.1 YebC/PmpR family DNA-binding transcriptional regulator [Campylobacter sp. VBCF_06 NA8]MDA3047283.1 YebC/PmpR family DNA-binding transcriptional regulator [Campylobacter sp. JMF_08 NE1]MDA30
MGRAFEYRRAAKEARWGKMSKLFPKLGKAITMAAKEGGEDPEMNAKLRAAIATAKAQNMPKDNIDAAIKRASGKDSAEIKTVFYDGKAPHGALVIVECATDNPTRTVANIKSAFNKGKGEFLPSGSLKFMFSRKAVFETKFPDGADIEELELELIDFGLSEIEVNEFENDKGESEKTLIIYGEYENFGTLNEGIEKLGLELISGNLKFIANDKHEFSDEQIADIDALLDRLEDDDDVQAIYTNIE